MRPLPLIWTISLCLTAFAATLLVARDATAHTILDLSGPSAAESTSFSPTTTDGLGASPASTTDLAGCPMLPADNIWNTPVDKLPVDAMSATYVNTIGAGLKLHQDYGSGLWDGGKIGIPFLTVPGNQSRVKVAFRWPNESDAGPYPIPTDAPIEGPPNKDSDRHILALDRDNCVLYELYHNYWQPDGSLKADSGAIFDLRSNQLRTDGWTSADAAGLPILIGLVRFDEVAAGEIRHAVRFAVPESRRAYVWPARHYASDLVDAKYPPMGQRFRMKASVNISGYSPDVQVILRALKKYGMILADNGSPWFIGGAPDERWDNDHLHEMDKLHGSDFEAVNVTSLMADPNSGRVKGAATEVAPPSPTPHATTVLPSPTPHPTSEPPTVTPPESTPTHAATAEASPTPVLHPATPTSHPQVPTATPFMVDEPRTLYMPRLYRAAR